MRRYIDWMKGHNSTSLGGSNGRVERGRSIDYVGWRGCGDTADHTVGIYAR